MLTSYLRHTISSSSNSLSFLTCLKLSPNRLFPFLHSQTPLLPDSFPFPLCPMPFPTDVFFSFPKLAASPTTSLFLFGSVSLFLFWLFFFFVPCLFQSTYISFSELIRSLNYQLIFIFIMFDVFVKRLLSIYNTTNSFDCSIAGFLLFSSNLTANSIYLLI